MIYQSLERIKTKLITIQYLYILARCLDIILSQKFLFNIQKKSLFSFSKFFSKARCTQTPSFPHSRNFFFQFKHFFFSFLKIFFDPKEDFFFFINISIQKRSFTRKLVIVEPDFLDRFLCFDS